MQPEPQNCLISKDRKISKSYLFLSRGLGIRLGAYVMWGERGFRSFFFPLFPPWSCPEASPVTLRACTPVTEAVCRQLQTLKENLLLNWKDLEETLLCSDSI
jgi:hypothetical protein